MAYSYMELDEVLDAEPVAADKNVSEVARSSRGFVTAYERAEGNPDFLGTDRYSGQWWDDRRKAFVSRHMGQIKRNSEPLWKDGEPTRRHLALMMWAYTPTRERTLRWLDRL